MEEHSLVMKGIAKSFPGVQALNGVDFDLRPGEVHALLGINGAGKSTLIKILAGIYEKDAGEIVIKGKPAEIKSPKDAKRLGIATVYQDPQMIPSFTGYENIFLGTETKSKSVFAMINRREVRKRAQQLLEKYPFHVDVTRPVRELEAVERESIAILRALSQDSTSILVLDEPTSILTRKEIDILFEQIRTLKQRDISIIYITHRLDEVFQIADRFTVLRDGRNVGTYEVGSRVDSNLIAELMLGEKLAHVYPEKNEKTGAELMQVEALCLGSWLDDINFTVRTGEVLGIFGLVGSGFDELCKALFGVLPVTSGSIRINGEEKTFHSSADAIRSGLFLVPGDRRTEGQISDQSVSFNLSLSNLEKVAGGLGLMRAAQEQAGVRSLIESLKIKTPSPAELVSLLSGGNQQKVVIGKGLFTDSQIYIFEEPTVGVDVGAKSGIYHLISNLSKEKAVVVVSSDVEEVFGLCDRILVIYRGKIVMNKPASKTRLDEMLVYGLTGGAQHANESIQ